MVNTHVKETEKLTSVHKNEKWTLRDVGEEVAISYIEW